VSKIVLILSVGYSVFIIYLVKLAKIYSFSLLPGLTDLVNKEHQGYVFNTSKAVNVGTYQSLKNGTKMDCKKITESRSP